MGLKVEPVPFYLRGMVKMLSRRRKDQVVLNWFEDRLNYEKSPFWEFLRCLAMLLVLRCCFKRIHWVRHNFAGHDRWACRFRKILEWVLKHLATTRITHRPLHGYTYLPHPLYPVDCSLQNERDIRFLYFGAIKSYKGLEELLQHWDPAVPMHMVGSGDDALQKRLRKIIEERALTVDWRQSFIPDAELNQLLSRTQCVIIPHREASMIVSGAAYHALSCGAQLLVRQGSFATYLQGELGDAVSVFNNENLSQVLECFEYRAAEGARQQVAASFGDELLADGWRPLLEGGSKDQKKPPNSREVKRL